MDFPAVLAKAAQLRATYNVTVLPQAKKLGKQLGQLELPVSPVPPLWTRMK